MDLLLFLLTGSAMAVAFIDPFDLWAGDDDGGEDTATTGEMLDIGMASEVAGGSGDDTITGSDVAGVRVTAGDGADWVELSGSGAEIRGEGGNDVLIAAGPGHLLFGGAGDDSLEASDAARLEGGAGDDTLLSAGGVARGGDGDDQLTLTPTSGEAMAEGGPGDDRVTLVLDAASLPLEGDGIVLSGGAGSDVIEVRLPEAPASGAADLGRIATVTDFAPGQDRLEIETELTPGSGTELLGYDIVPTDGGTHTDIVLRFADPDPDLPHQTASIRLDGTSGVTDADIDIRDSTRGVFAA